MSISDNKDSSKSQLDSEQSSKASSARRKLSMSAASAEDLIDTSYHQTAALLRAPDESSTSTNDYCTNDDCSDLIIIPSLVSLSEAFFQKRLEENSKMEFSSAAPNLAASLAQSTSTTHSFFKPRKHDLNTRDQLQSLTPAAVYTWNRPVTPPIGPQGAPLPFYGNELAATQVNYSQQHDHGQETSTIASILERNSNISDMDSDSTNINNSIHNSSGSNIINNNQRNTVTDMISTINDSHPNTSDPFMQQQQQHHEQQQQQSISTSAPGRLSLLSSLDMPRQAHTPRFHAHLSGISSPPPNLNQQFQQSCTQELQYINTLQSLTDAVHRLEYESEKRKQKTGDSNILTTASIPTSPATNRGDLLQEIDDIESRTTTQLAEIMLHPPTGIMRSESGTYLQHVWDDFDNDGGLMKEDEKYDTTVTEEQWLQRGMHKETDGKDDQPTHVFASSFTTASSAQENYDPRRITRPSRYQNVKSAHHAISSLGLSIPRRVCQYPFRRNDIVWICYTCQSDESCVLCHECFTHSNHDGHDVVFYHAQAGGCCDCGDADAWDPAGFCSKHGGGTSGALPGTAVAKIEPSVLGCVHACADWMVEVIQRGVEEGFRRANPLTVDGGKKRPVTRSDSFLPEWYHEIDGGRDHRQQRDRRREQSLTRRNTVADVETIDMVDLNNGEAGHDFPFETTEAALADIDSENIPESSRVVTTHMSNISHEVQFDPAAASSSKKRGSASKRGPDADSISISGSFDPKAASSSKSSIPRPQTKVVKYLSKKSPARALGDLGRDQHGLFLVVHADEIHVGAHHPTEVIEALKELFSNPGGDRMSDLTGTSASPVSNLQAMSYLPGGLTSRAMGNPQLTHFRREGDVRTNRYSLLRAPQVDAILIKIVRLIQKHGNLIVWGTQELIAECGIVIAQCWRDGDPTSSSLIGAAMLNRAKILTSKGIVCSIKTRYDLQNEQKVTAVIRLIASIAQSCDPLCDQVASGISGRGVSPTLPAMLRSDLKLPNKVTIAWHALLLTLLAVPDFKAALAVAYCDTYLVVTREFARGVGMLDRSSFTLSVQFLNRVTYVENLVRDHNLLSKLTRSMLETMSSAAFVPGSPGSPPPAGASSEMLQHFDSFNTEPTLAAALLTLMGYITTNEEFLSPELESEISDLLNGISRNISGGDSRHHGRSALSREIKEDKVGLSTQQTELKDVMKNTSLISNPTLNPNHPVLQHRRYSACCGDLKCVLNVKGMSRYFASVPADTNDKMLINSISPEGLALDNWINTLSLAQNMDGQMWRSFNQGHVESQPKGWINAFNASISLGSLFERLLNWEDSDPSPICDSVRLLSCTELTHYTLLHGVYRWQRSQMLSHRPSQPGLNVPDYASCPASLPFSSVALAHGSTCAMAAIPFSQSHTWSFHLPLHRFVAACLREVSRRGDEKGISTEGGGIAELIHMFDVSGDISNPDAGSSLRKNASLFRGLMELPMFVLSRAAQIRAGIWRRNGSGMLDQVTNYSEPPFCRVLLDADLLLIQFSLLCLSPQRFCNLMASGVTEKIDRSLIGVISQSGVSRLVNLFLHRFGVFDFLGFENAASANADRYTREVIAGLYPSEIQHPNSESLSNSPTLPWVYSPVKDFATCMNLVEEVLHFIIILITEMPSPPAKSIDDPFKEAKRRLRREVIHRLASGPKTHSEMTEVQLVLSQRDNLVLCIEGKKINPDDSSGAALEAALNEVAIRTCRVGDADHWQLKSWAWDEYDPSFHHISTTAHQSATESRPKPSQSTPYAPRPALAHSSFLPLRRDLTADACILSITYRVLHSYCHQVDSPKSTSHLRGRVMYEKGAKSETALSRAVHILTLGAFSWEDSAPHITDWRHFGGGSIGSVFHDWPDSSAPAVNNWVEMALLRKPDEVMKCSWYQGEETTLLLLKRIAEDGSSVDESLRSGATWLCDFAAKWNPTAATSIGKKSFMDVDIVSNNLDGKLEYRKTLAKARQKQAMARMKAQMTKFAQSVDLNPQSSDQDDFSEEGRSISSSTDRNESSVNSSFSTPIRLRKSGDLGANTELHAIDLGSPGDFILTTPPPSSPDTPSSPRLPHSRSSTPRNRAQIFTARLLNKPPECIICGVDSDFMQVENLTTEGKTTLLHANQDRALAFCGYAQASTVAKGGGGCPPIDGLYDSNVNMLRHVGVHVSLCGHAVHQICIDAFLRTVLQRDIRLIDRLEGGKRREFRCPLCQRLSNCFIPFIDVANDWIDLPTAGIQQQDSVELKCKEDVMAIEGKNNETLNDFLSMSTWWTARNDKSKVWDGQCSFHITEKKESKLSCPTISSPLQSINKTHLFGKKELIGAWSRVLTPRMCRRDHALPSDRSQFYDESEFPSVSESHRPFQEVTDVWRRFMDTIADTALKADIKRLGEDNLMNDYGEFRHYLTEKAMCNAVKKAACRKEVIDWPMCISSVDLSEAQRQELSKEKLISKLLFSIQAFTYSCCCEAAEARRLFRRISETSSLDIDKTSALFTQFGIDKASRCGELLLFPDAESRIEGGTQPFGGRLGRLRYLGLALMVATSPVSDEVVQLCMSFPYVKLSTTDQDFNEEKKDYKKRVPVVFPLLCSHILTHITSALLAVTGRARVEKGSYSVDCIIDEACNFIKLGVIARVAQCLLALLMPMTGQRSDHVANLRAVVDYMTLQKSNEEDDKEREWDTFCLSILQILISQENEKSSTRASMLVPSHYDEEGALKVSNAIISVKNHIIAFLKDLSLIAQILIPNIFATNRIHQIIQQNGQIMTWKLFMNLFHIENLPEMLDSCLVKELIRSWYNEAADVKNNQLAIPPKTFQLVTWPIIPSERYNITESLCTVPLLGTCDELKHNDSFLSCKISCLPRSYTDLYAELSALFPDCDQTALCLVCGQVLNATGNGECTRHAFQCGAGAGIFFLLQECVTLILHGVTAAYVQSPYVDSHGETPQYRGRPLNLDVSRYNILQRMWSGNSVREKVSAERGSTRHLIVPNFY